MEIKNKFNMEQLDRRILSELIENIYVLEKNKIEIKFKNN